MQEDSILITDMSLCLPTTALSNVMKKDHWRVVPYETEFGFGGKMVFTDPTWKSPSLELPLNVKGVYKIFLGINYTKSYLAQANSLPRPEEGVLEVKLSNDCGFVRVTIEDTPGYKPSKIGIGKLVARSIQEAYWKTAKLDGQSLIFRCPGEPYNMHTAKEMANLSFIRLDPLTSEETKVYRKLKTTKETKRGIYVYCTGMLSGNIDGGPDYHPTSKEWFYNEIAPAVDGDFKIFSVEAIRGNYCTFKTKIGDVGGKYNTWKPNYTHEPDWLDPLENFCNVCHEHDLEIFAAMRMIGGQYPTSYYPISWQRYFWENVHLCKVTKDGYPTTSLSIAYPQVCNHWLDLLKEAITYDIDGIAVYLHRFCPFVLYEEPVVKSFIKEYGIDPRELDERDQIYLKHCAHYVTDFLRQVKELTLKKKIKLAVSFFGVPAKLDKNPESWEPLTYNYDVETWIKEGIVDILMPMQAPKAELVRRLAILGQGKIEICPDIHPRFMPGEEFAKKAKAYYDAGATGYCLNDAERRSTHISEWAIQKRLGHIDMLDYLKGTALKLYRRIPLKTMQGFSCRYSFNNFGDEDIMFMDKKPIF